MIKRKKKVSVAIAVMFIIANIVTIFSGCSLFDNAAKGITMFELGLATQTTKEDYNDSLNKEVSKEDAIIAILKVTSSGTNSTDFSPEFLEDNLSKGITDIDAIDPLYKGRVAIAYKNGFLHIGSDKKLNPKGAISGSEVAYILYSALGYDIEPGKLLEAPKLLKEVVPVKVSLDEGNIKGKDFYDLLFGILKSKNKKGKKLDELLVNMNSVNEKYAMALGFADDIFAKRIQSKVGELRNINIAGINEYMIALDSASKLEEYIENSKGKSAELKKALREAKRAISEKKAQLKSFIDNAKKISLAEGQLSGINIYERSFVASGISKTAPTISQSADKVVIENAFSKYEFGTDQVLTLNSIINKEVGGEMLTGSSNGSLLSVKINGYTFTEKDFVLDNVSISKSPAARMTALLKLNNSGIVVEVTVTVTLSDSPQADFDLSIKNLSDKEIKAEPTFPNLKGIKLGENASDDWYMYPRKGGIISKAPVNLKSEQTSVYGYSVTFPIMDLYDEKEGGGFYILSKEKFDELRFLLFQKTNNYTDMGIKYYTRNIKAGGEWKAATAALGVHPGDWYQAFKAYEEYKNSWYTPSYEIEWLKDTVQFKQVFSTYKTISNTELAPKPSEQVEPIFKRGDTEYSGYQTLHWFDWMTNLGDYMFNGTYGGSAMVRLTAEATHNLGKTFSLYTEGILANTYSNIAKETNNDIYRKLQSGALYGTTETYDITCTAAPVWQDHYVARLMQIANDIPLDCLYLDQYGNHTAAPCYSTTHNHEDNYCGLAGQIEAAKRIRESLDTIRPDIAIGGEYAVSDYLAQYMNYCFNYNSNLWYNGTDGSGVKPYIDLYGFLFPNIRLFNLTIKIKNGVDWVEDAEAIGIAFFNGQGRWHDEGYTIWDDKAKQTVKTTMLAVNAFKHVFYGENKVPMLKTSNENVYVNKFSDEDSTKTVYNILNRTRDNVFGFIVEVENPDDYMYFDLLANKQLTPKKSGNQVQLDITVEMNGVGSIAIIKK